MADGTKVAERPEEDASSSFSTAYTILFLLIILIAALTWFIPAGSYDRVMRETFEQEIVVADAFKVVASNPQGIADVLLAAGAGFYDPDTYLENPIDVALFTLILGRLLGIMKAGGAIDTGIRTVKRKLEGRECWIIPIMICAGGEGIPVLRRPDGTLIGVEPVTDKGAASALLAADTVADALLLLTEVDDVYDGLGTDAATPLRHLTLTEARALDMTKGSIGPKLAAACDFADRGGISGIGRLADALAILDGTAGTRGFEPMRPGRTAANR
jgi:hypothetical protein